jgi:hypothetical protein
MTYFISRALHIGGHVKQETLHAHFLCPCFAENKNRKFENNRRRPLQEKAKYLKLFIGAIKNSLLRQLQHWHTNK